MSDVTVAPQGGAPAAAPAAPAPATETVINQNPVNTPAPIGSQAPDKPAGDRPPSRREAIEAAFKRAENPQADRSKPGTRPAPKPADAKPGHNQPPEDTPKLDLKKRPDDQPQPRGDRGQFAPRQAQEGVQPRSANQAPQQQPGQQSPIKQLPPGAPFRDPPVRMAEHGKRDWADTPETVRGEVHRVQAEFAKAYKYYKDDAEIGKPVRHFHQLAQSHGTTLDKALNNYVSMEAKLREDPIAGLDIIVNNLGLTTPDGQRLGLRDIAYHVLSQSPEQLRQIQQGNTQQAAAQQIGQLHQQVQGLQNQLQEMHNQQRFTYTRSAVDQFADSHPRFDELGAAVERELKFGFDLETAYRRAELLHPATQAAQTRTPSAQTRSADRSISGAPDVAPSNGASRRPREASRTPRDAVQNAMRRLNGGGI